VKHFMKTCGHIEKPSIETRISALYCAKLVGPGPGSVRLSGCSAITRSNIGPTPPNNRCGTHRPRHHTITSMAAPCSTLVHATPRTPPITT